MLEIVLLSQQLELPFFPIKICLPFEVISECLSWINTLGSYLFTKTFRKYLFRIQCTGIGLKKKLHSNIPILFAWAWWWRPGQGRWSTRRWQDHLLPPGLDRRHQLLLHVSGLGSCPAENSQCPSSCSCWHPVSLHTSQESACERGKTKSCSSLASHWHWSLALLLVKIWYQQWLSQVSPLL